jgi:hypothetical protein
MVRGKGGGYRRGEGKSLNKGRQTIKTSRL